MHVSADRLGHFFGLLEVVPIIGGQNVQSVHAKRSDPQKVRTVLSPAHFSIEGWASLLLWAMILSTINHCFPIIEDPWGVELVDLLFIALLKEKATERGRENWEKWEEKERWREKETERERERCRERERDRQREREREKKKREREKKKNKRERERERDRDKKKR